MDDMKAKLASALSVQPLGAIAMADLARLYRQINKEKLDFTGLGFESLQKLLEAMPDTIQVKYDKKSSDYRVFLVNYELSEAIEREIINQSQLSNSKDTSHSTRGSKKYGDRQNDTFVDTTRTGEDTRRPISRLRDRPITTLFRGQNDWDLYLQNFPIGTKENDLMDIFKSFGCTRIRIKKRENETLFGFATFREYADAEVAYVTLDGSEFKGRPLNIQFAKSSIASEDEVRTRLEKTQFTTEVNSSRRRKFSPDDNESVNRREVTQPDHYLNFRRTNSQPDSRCHSHLHKGDSSRLPWQPFASPGYITIGNEGTWRGEVGSTYAHTRGITSSNNDKKEVGHEGAKFTSEDNSPGTETLDSDRKRSVQSFSTRVVHNSEGDAETVVNITADEEGGKTGQFDPWRKPKTPKQLNSSQSNDSTNSDRIAQMDADKEIGEKQSNSTETHESSSESTAENDSSEEQLDSDEIEEKTKRLDFLSNEKTLDQLNSSTNNAQQCTIEIRSNRIRNLNISTSPAIAKSREPVDSQEIRGRHDNEDTFNQNSDACICIDIRDGKEKIGCSLNNTNFVSDISLSETQNDSIPSTDNRGSRLVKTDVNIALPVSEGIDPGIRKYNGDLETERCTFECKRSATNGSIQSRASETAFDIAPRWLRVYVRDDILLVEDIQIWIKIYSRNGKHLDYKYQCRPLIQSKKFPVDVIPSLSFKISNSTRPETDTVSSESLSIEAEPSTPKTPVDSSVGRCCAKTPDTMGVQFLQAMLMETHLEHGFLSQNDLPDELDLIVVHVCDSNHFWGSVINPGELMNEYEELFAMMDDVAIKARPEFRLDKARPEDKRAGVMYQDTDWCRVWIKSEVGNSEVEVFYVDFGNSELRSIDDLWVLPRKAWHLRPMVLPFHLTGHLAKKTLFEMVNTRIKVIRSQPSATDFVVTVRPYKELDCEDIN